MFPTENRETYYAPYYNDSVTGSKSLAKGKLHDRYHHFRGILLKSGAVTSARGRKKNFIVRSGTVKLGFYDNISSEGIVNIHIEHIISVIFVYVIVKTNYFFRLFNRDILFKSRLATKLNRSFRNGRKILERYIETAY